MLLYREKGSWKGSFELKFIGGNREFRVVAGSHWPGCATFLLAELLARHGGQVTLLLPGLPLVRSGRVLELPLLASPLHFK